MKQRRCAHFPPRSAPDSAQPASQRASSAAIRRGWRHALALALATGAGAASEHKDKADWRPARTDKRTAGRTDGQTNGSEEAGRRGAAARASWAARRGVCDLFYCRRRRQRRYLARESTELEWDATIAVIVSEAAAAAALEAPNGATILRWRQNNAAVVSTAAPNR